MEAVEQLKQLMRETCHDPKPIPELCEMINRSYHTMKRQFHVQAHKTMSQFYTGERLKEAARRLRETDDRIFEIAFGLGFRDESNFSSWFHKNQGVSPTAYREPYRRKHRGRDE